jgi:phospholipase C
MPSVMTVTRAVTLAAITTLAPLTTDTLATPRTPPTATTLATAVTGAPRVLRVSAGPALDEPFGVARDRRGDVWAAERGNGQLAEFSPSGQPLAVLHPAGRAALDQPEGIAVSPAGDLWVADTGHHRLVELTTRGAVVATAGATAGPGRLSAPAAVVVTGSGRVYAADQAASKISEFSPAGAYLASFPVPTPDGVAAGPSGVIWVSSPGYAFDPATGSVSGNTVREFSASGAALTSFGQTQSGLGALSNPAGIAVSTAGQVYLSQPDFGWISVFSSQGRYQAEFGAGQGTPAASPTPAAGSASPTAGSAGSAQAAGGTAAGGRLAGLRLSFPQGIALTAAGQLWVADSGSGRLVEFGPVGTAGPAPVPADHSLPWEVWLLAAIVVIIAAFLGFATWSRRRTGPPPRNGPSSVTPDTPGAVAPDPGSPTPRAEIGTGGDGGVSRRVVLARAAVGGGSALGLAALPLSLRSALAATMARPPRGSLRDVQHIVILMQENRSFDHYFGTMPGVRGFSDPQAMRLPSGRTVFHQPDPSHAQGYRLPFRFDTATTSAQATPGTDHFWPTQHQAWNGGRMDQWVAAKGPFTMGYFTREDIPFHWALAGAFTVCDRYHCSVLGPTNPNRLYMWTGMIDPARTGGGPVIDDSPGSSNPTLSWTTYPERLQRAGVSWQVYQEEDNFDDNALAWFKQFASAPVTSELYQRGMLKRPAGTFEDDARHDRLPQVSWLVAPAAQSEHPDYFPAAGAEYIAQKLEAIASNPDVWAKTAFILCYDENDGLFDHVPPPVPPAGTVAEFVGGEPIGLGFRAPAIVISPWTAGGYVHSEVLDHTSLIRLIETRFGVREPNISAWRRRTCGDFTSAFRFSRPARPFPASNAALRVAAAETALLAAQQEVSANPAPTAPSVNPPLPSQ